MARPLKYRFDLLEPGESMLCEGAKEADVVHRIMRFIGRKYASGQVPNFHVRPYANGVSITRHDDLATIPAPDLAGE